MTPDHWRTALAALSLSLTGLEEGDLAPPLNRTNLMRLRDLLEIADLLANPSPQLWPADLDTVRLCLTATHGVLSDGTALIGPPDMLAALTLPQVEDTLDHLNSLLTLALVPLACKGEHDA